VLALKKTCSATQAAPCTASAAAAPAAPAAPTGGTGGSTTGTCPGAVGGKAGLLNAEGVSATDLIQHTVCSAAVARHCPQAG
jgi:hypothetical protein